VRVFDSVCGNALKSPAE